MAFEWAHGYDRSNTKDFFFFFFWLVGSGPISSSNPPPHPYCHNFFLRPQIKKVESLYYVELFHTKLLGERQGQNRMLGGIFLK